MPSRLIDVLAEYDTDTVDVSDAQLANPIRLIFRSREALDTPVNELSMVGVDILYPLE